MISIEELKAAEGNNIRVTCTNGKVIEGFCYSYQQPEDEDEEYMLEIGEHWAISQSEIKSIEIIN